MDNEGNTPLLLAVKNKQNDICLMLCAAKADTHATDSKGLNFWNYASKELQSTLHRMYGLAPNPVAEKQAPSDPKKTPSGNDSNSQNSKSSSANTPSASERSYTRAPMKSSTTSRTSSSASSTSSTSFRTSGSTASTSPNSPRTTSSPTSRTSSSTNSISSTKSQTSQKTQIDSITLSNISADNNFTEGVLKEINLSDLPPRKSWAKLGDKATDTFSCTYRGTQIVLKEITVDESVAPFEDIENSDFFKAITAIV